MVRKRQPIRLAPAESYGDRQALQAQQQAAPLMNVAGQEEQQRRQLLDQATQGAVTPEYDVFAPTRRPNEPITTGVPVGPGAGPEPDFREDPDIALQVMLQDFPHSAILRLLMQGGNL